MGNDAWFVRVRARADAVEAERRLYTGLGSPIDTLLDRVLHRRLSRHVTRVALASSLTPNQISVASLLVGLVAAWCFWGATPLSALVGLAVYLLAVVLDHADGEVARLTGAESVLGAWLDILVDTAVHALTVLAMGATARAEAGAGVGLGGVAAVGVVLSAALANLRPPTPDAVGEALTSLGSRDGFYLMLALFVLVRALRPDLLPWLMIVVAVGSNAYWLASLTHLLLTRRR
jgi:phosphatidylglycerophosphate synthase